MYDTAPKNIHSGQLPDDFVSKAKSRTVHCFEQQKGISFVVSNDNGKILIDSEEASEETVQRIIEYFNNNLIKPFSRLIQFFENQNFLLYGEYITSQNSKTPYAGPSRIFFYDMYINENWIYNDDFIEIFSKIELPIPPVIGQYIVNNKFLSKIESKIKINSNINGFQELYGLYVKPLVGVGVHRNISKGAYVYYNDKYKKKENKKSKKKDYLEHQKTIEEVADFSITKDVLNSWEIILKSRNIEKSKNNLGQIMPILVNDFLRRNTEELDILSLELNTSREESEDLMKKFIPKIIIQKFFEGKE